MFKFWTATTSERLCKARDYPERARAAVKEMHRQVGDLVLDGNGIAKVNLGIGDSHLYRETEQAVTNTNSFDFNQYLNMSSKFSH